MSKGKHSEAQGLGVAMSPAMVYIALSGMSEVLFVLFVLVGMIAILKGGASQCVGALEVGLAPLVRTNYILFPVIFSFLVLLFPQARHAVRRENWKMLLVLGALACLPTLLWVLRNYTVTGKFPLLSALEGETLWGSNNPATSQDLANWGA